MEKALSSYSTSGVGSPLQSAGTYVMGVLAEMLSIQIQIVNGLNAKMFTNPKVGGGGVDNSQYTGGYQPQAWRGGKGGPYDSQGYGGNQKGDNFGGGNKNYSGGNGGYFGGANGKGGRNPGKGNGKPRTPMQEYVAMGGVKYCREFVEAPIPKPATCSRPNCIFSHNLSDRQMISDWAKLLPDCKPIFP